MKKIYLAAFLLFSLFTPILGSLVPAHAQFTWPPFCQESSLPSGDPKNPEDHQLIVICIPPNWNGRLILYARGYALPQLTLALPIDELTLEDGTFVPIPILMQGFAFATTSFRKKGVAIEQGAEDLNQLLEHFKSVAPRPPGKVYITGASEGGLIAVLLLERYSSKYDAGLALCAPLAGSPDLIKHIYDFRVVFDYFFPNVFPFGAVDVPNDAFLLWQTPDPNDNDYVKLITEALTNAPR